MVKILSTEEVKAPAETGHKLTRAQKADVVRRLAAYESPNAIARAMKEELGIEITPQAIAFYDPTRYSGKACPRHWAVLFRKVRAEIIASRPDVGVAHHAVRLRWLDAMAHAAMDKGNSAEARALLKQAADEISRMMEQRDGSHATDSELGELSEAELHERFAAIATRLGYERPGGPAPGDRSGAADAAQPAGEPLSG